MKREEGKFYTTNLNLCFTTDKLNRLTKKNKNKKNKEKLSIQLARMSRGAVSSCASYFSLVFLPTVYLPSTSLARGAELQTSLSSWEVSSSKAGLR